MKIDHIRIPCHDLIGLHLFFEEKIGLKCLTLSQETGILMFNAGAINLIFEQSFRQSKNSSVKISCPIKKTGISFSVKDVFSHFEHLKSKGVIFSSELLEQTWGGWQADFLDPENNQFSLAGF